MKWLVVYNNIEKEKVIEQLKQIDCIEIDNISVTNLDINNNILSIKGPNNLQEIVKLENIKLYPNSKME